MTTPNLITANDRILAFVRTYVPYAVTALVAWLLVHGVDLQGAPAVALIAFGTALATNGYYLVVRLLEQQIPILGIFLGAPKLPSYTGVSDLWASVVRTCIPPLVAAFLITVSAFLGFAIDVNTQADLIVIGIAVVEALYYALAKLLVGRWPSSLGWLLGGQYAPSYPAHA